MEKEFEKVYDELKKEFGEKYKPLISDKFRKNTLYLFFGWIIISFIKTLLKRIGFAELAVYICMDLLDGIILLVLMILVFYLMNRNFEYWKKAFEFKKDVGIKFWKNFDKNNEYKVFRKEINYEEVKKELDNMLSDNTNIIDIEDELIFDNCKMCTIRYDTQNKIRFTGVFVIIEDFEKEVENIEEYIKSANLNISSIVKKSVQKENKVYILLDAVEVFKFSNKNFFKESELYGNYIRYKEIKKL